jgi:hypothetical protein
MSASQGRLPVSSPPGRYLGPGSEQALHRMESPLFDLSHSRPRQPDAIARVRRQCSQNTQLRGGGSTLGGRLDLHPHWQYGEAETL